VSQSSHVTTGHALEPAPLQGLAEAVRNLEKIHSPLQSTERLWTVLLECACIMIPSSTGCVLKGEGGNWQLLSAFGADADVNSILAFVNGSWDHRSNSLPADIFSLPAEPWVQTADVESRGLVFLPLRVGEIGMLLVLAPHEPQVLLDPAWNDALSIYVSQAALHLQLVRLEAHIDNSHGREHQLNDLLRTITGEMDLPLILQKVVQIATELVQTSAGALALLTSEGDRLEYAYLYNLPQSLSEQALIKGQGLAWQVVENQEAVCVPEYAHLPYAIPTWVEAGVRAAVAAPISVGEQHLGALLLFCFDLNRSFTQAEAELVEMVGWQAGVALQNARLFGQERRRADEFEALRTALTDLSAELELPQLLDAILQRAVQLLLASGGELGLLDDPLGKVQIVSSYRLGRNAGGEVPKSGEDILAAVIQSGRPLIVDDYPLWNGRTKPLDQDSPLAVLAAPLVSSGRLLGGISIMDARPERKFTQDDLSLLALFAQQVAITVENARLYADAQRLAALDPLTGIVNRRHFFLVGRREIERAQRYNQPLSIVMIDIDHFKHINDTLGHSAGDRVLQRFAGFCASLLREVDLFARYGGEEFVILLPNTPQTGAQRVAERLLERVGALEVQLEDSIVQLTISLGVAQMRAEYPSLETLLQCADQALYQAKQKGRDRVCVYEAEQA
jgi:diguanylate cyclase (GGDEF)-like protein